MWTLRLTAFFVNGVLSGSNGPTTNSLPGDMYSRSPSKISARRMLFPFPLPEIRSGNCRAKTLLTPLRLYREKCNMRSSPISIPQLADLFSVLPHDQMMKMMELLPEDQATRIKAIISDLECTADALMSSDFVRAKKSNSVVQVLREIRGSRREPHSLSYVYLLDDERTLLGVVDLREIVLAADTMLLGDMMVSPVVSAQQDDTREDLAELFARYQFHLIPVVDEHDRMLGVVYYRDIMKGLVTRARS